MFKNIILMCILMGTILPLTATERKKELGLLNYFAKYEHPDKRREKLYSKHLKKYFTQLEKLGHTPEWVDVDVFLPSQKAERDTFKRIIISYHADWFTLEMYQGMLDYVQSGGLLITHAGLVLLDKNSEYQCSGGTTSFCRESFVGVLALGGSQKPEIKALVDNPLTTGLELNKWISIGDRVSGRTTKKLTANVAVSCKQIEKKGESEGPFLSWKSTGKGACIYLVSIYWAEIEPIHIMMKNILSEETLKWLCIQNISEE